MEKATIQQARRKVIYPARERTVAEGEFQPDPIKEEEISNDIPWGKVHPQFADPRGQSRNSRRGPATGRSQSGFAYTSYNPAFDYEKPAGKRKAADDSELPSMKSSGAPPVSRRAPNQPTPSLSLPIRAKPMPTAGRAAKKTTPKPAQEPPRKSIREPAQKPSQERTQEPSQSMNLTMRLKGKVIGKAAGTAAAPVIPTSKEKSSRGRIQKKAGKPPVKTANVIHALRKENPTPPVTNPSSNGGADLDTDAMFEILKKHHTEEKEKQAAQVGRGRYQTRYQTRLAYVEECSDEEMM